jgi:hypothetical protein
MELQNPYKSRFLFIVMQKKAQQVMGMSFGMIFSLFLIVIFIAIAFIAIKAFLGTQEAVNAGLFYQELQEEVDASWNGQASEANFKINLPSKITKVCFANLSAEITGSKEEYGQIENYEVYDANVFLIPPKNARDLAYKSIDHLDIEKITSNENPYCVDSSSSLSIKKDFYDKLVFVQ